MQDYTSDIKVLRSKPNLPKDTCTYSCVPNYESVWVSIGTYEPSFAIRSNMLSIYCCKIIFMR